MSDSQEIKTTNANTMMIFQMCLKLHSDKLGVTMITLGSVMILLVDQRTPWLLWADQLNSELKCAKIDLFNSICVWRQLSQPWWWVNQLIYYVQSRPLSHGCNNWRIYQLKNSDIFNCDSAWSSWSIFLLVEKLTNLCWRRLLDGMWISWSLLNVPVWATRDEKLSAKEGRPKVEVDRDAGHLGDDRYAWGGRLVGRR